MTDSATEQPATASEDALAPEDRAWQARRSSIAPLAFGVIGMAASPLLLGLVCGPIGLRSGIDLWRSGMRRASVVLGVAASLMAIVLSVVAAVLWGSILAGVLLTRDALRETQRWVGKPLPAVDVETVGSTGPTHMTLAPAEGDTRLILVFIAPEHPASRATLQTLADMLPKHPGVRVIAVDSQHTAAQARAALVADGIDFAAIGLESSLPPPLEAVAILPTVVVIDRTGRIEAAAAGGRPAEEIERMMSGPSSISESPSN